MANHEIKCTANIALQVCSSVQTLFQGTTEAAHHRHCNFNREQDARFHLRARMAITKIIINETPWTYRCWIWRHLDADPVLFQACWADAHLAQGLLTIPEDWPRWMEGQVAPGGASWGLGERGRHVATAARASVAENKNVWIFKRNQNCEKIHQSNFLILCP